MRAYYRLVIFILYAIFFLLRVNRGNASSLVRRIIGSLAKKLNVTYTVQGDFPVGRPYLIVANHKSYLDGVVLLALTDLTILVKDEVANWSIIGSILKKLNSVFVKRDNKYSRNVAQIAIRKALENGQNVLVFPEGTTSAGIELKPFYAGSFHAAVAAGVPVVPVAIYYHNDRHSWSSNMTFLDHFLSVFNDKHIKIDVVVGFPVLENNAHETRDYCQNWIQNRLSVHHRTVQEIERHGVDF